MWYISMYHASNIGLIRHDLKIYDIHTLSICINSFNCLHKWKLEMWKNPSRLKLSNSSYTSRALTSNDTKETQHKFHKKKKIPNSDNNDLTNKNWLPKRSLSWYRNILEQESALNENTLKIKTTHKSPGTIMRHPKHYAFYLQSNTW